MNYVNKIFLFILFTFFSASLIAQKNTEKLKKEQERLEKNISNTKNLLAKTKSSTEATLNELKLIDNQVKFREELIQNFDNQIKSTELKIQQKNNQISQLEDKLISLKRQYKELTIYAYKKRSAQGKMMFIFSSKNYYEALKRKRYLEKVAEIQRKQKLVILQHKKLIHSQKKELIVDKKYKENVAQEKRVEKKEILEDKNKQLTTLTKLKTEEQKLLTKLHEDEAKKANIKSQIDAAIEKELAESDKKSGKSKKNIKNPDKSSSKEKKEVVFIEPQDLALNSSFETNKGRLPWPVTSGSITEKYGKNAHPSIPNVYTNNNGIDISSAKGAQVRAVFEGEVSSVFSIQGAGKVVIIKHGNYRTVYSNLQDAYVSVGTKVNTKQIIGALLTNDSENISVSHFEIHQVVGSQVNRMNPSLWISK
jgi:septal ring factor EnvC (AmiA/AmiB activator)